MTMLIDRRGLAAMLAGGALLAGCAGAEAPPLLAASGPAVAPDRELMVPVEGGRIYVRVNGRIDAGRPPLLLAHGGPGGTHASLMPALALAGERAVILYDQLDSGRSEKPGNPANWRPARFAGEVEAIRAALGLSRFHFLGHSWGATVALEYAARRPAGLASLILQGPLISTRVWLEDAARLRAMLPREVQAELDRCEGPAPPPKPRCDAAVDAFYARFWRLRPPPAWIGDYERAHGLAANKAIYEAMWGPSEFRSTGTLRDYDGEPLLARIAAPTLFLIGESDEITAESARRFAGRADGAELVVIPDAAHRIQTDRPEAWLAALQTWLRRHDRT